VPLEAALLPPDAAATTARTLLALERDRAERFLNAVRLVVLALLAVAALIYSPSLTTPLNRVNVLVLAPALTWTVVQYPLFYARHLLPPWLSLVNSVVDISAASAIIGGYALASSPALALKTPILAAYFVILAALPVASTTRKAALVSVLAVAEYTALVFIFAASGTLALIMNPVRASMSGGVSPLDEGAKILLLACAGAVATYATRWQERLANRYAHAARERVRLQSRLAESQLEALKLQLHPHFLFNTLNAITALIHRDPGRAEQMVTGLSELLRVSLGSAGVQEVPLARELEILEYYVDIQQVRFRDRLTVTIDAEPDTQRALVPNLILQPLVENAIKHGIAPRAAAGHIDVVARRRDGVLVLAVRDDGVGESVIEERREGVGLANSRARLTSLYGDAQRFSAAGRPGGGFSVEIELPFHTEPVVRRTDVEGALA
jgi:signal transduction histidine kinase